MDNQKFSVRKFSGLPHENAKSFISDFKAYCDLMKLSNDKLQKAAFQLHLQGPAKIWFENLEAVDWKSIQDEFKDKYVEISHSDFIFQTEKFQNFILQSQQSLDEYAGKISDCGLKLQKCDTDIMLTFINGFPQRLACFTRAGSPTTLEDALNAAKLGEAYGYRDMPETTETVASARPSSNIQDLEKKVDNLTHKLDKLMQKGNNTAPTSDSVCTYCYGAGHTHDQCNFARGQPDPDTQCQLCRQYGHEARQCKTRFQQQQGNFQRPRGDNRGPSRGPFINRGGARTERW